MNKIIIALLFLSLFNCQLKEVESKLIEVEKKEEESITGKGNDTVSVSGKSIIFFSVTQEEYDKIIKEVGVESGIDEVLSDLNYYSSRVSKKLSDDEYKIWLTASKTFELVRNDGRKSVINRDVKKGEVGIILFDGLKDPLISYEVGTDVDYINMVNDYFR